MPFNAQGRTEEAQQLFRQALALRPGYAEAEASYRQAVALEPSWAEASVQFDAAEQVCQAQANGFEIIDYTGEMKDYDDSATFMCNMHLIITICTSAAQLGAIAARTWLLLDFNPHWVRLTDRSDSPWYPTLTLYCQNRGSPGWHASRRTWPCWRTRTSRFDGSDAARRRQVLHSS